MESDVVGGQFFQERETGDDAQELEKLEIEIDSEDDTLLFEGSVGISIGKEGKEGKEEPDNALEEGEEAKDGAEEEELDSTKQETESHSFFYDASKKAFFLTSMPFYWFIIFKSLLGFFDVPLFIFAVSASMAMSIMGNCWGLIEW